MVTKALLVRLEAQHGKDDEVEAFLSSAVPLVQQEAGTIAWFAVKFGRSEFGIFDVFANEADRDAHLTGAVAKALMENAGELLTKAPDIQKIDVIASKLPQGPLPEANTKGLLLTFKAKDGHQQQVIQFLKDAQPMAVEEEQTTAWFAIDVSKDEFGIFDVFPDNGGRLKHMAGRIPRELVAHSLTLLGSFPDLDLLKVTAENFNLPTANL